MRLVDTSSLKLVTKHNADLPPYAILSHTWGADADELTLQELEQVNSRLGQLASGITSHHATKKPGFKKLRESAAIALKEGYQYIWIDTCCIDKTSSAELSEAINSMFRWYRDADVCYVFLDDVETPPVHSDNLRDFAVDDPGYVPGNSTIRRSRWFTRGWTLQELIAPSNVRFYSNKWGFLGSKAYTPEAHAGFPRLISDITGIDMDVLLGYAGLEQVSVAQRMHWASKRQTTRVEDAAYCLMGIFGVNMPLLYGEGDQAFIRLQVEILRATTDQSIFAWQCQQDDVLRYQLSGLLAPSPACFRHSGHIRLPAALLDTREATSAPSSMTNAGLHVRVQLAVRAGVEHGTEGAEHFGILDCAPYALPDSGPDRMFIPCIVLRALGGDQFARVHANTRFSAPTHETNANWEREPRYIYVKQFSVQAAPAIRVNFQSPDMIIDDVHPKQGWNHSSNVLKPEKPDGNGILGAIRFHVGQEMVDVFVGMSTNLESQQSTRYWCYQMPCQTSDLLWVKHNFDRLRRKQHIYTENLDEQSFCLGRLAAVTSEQLHGKSYLSLTVRSLPELHSIHRVRKGPDMSDLLDIAELDANMWKGVPKKDHHVAPLTQLFRTHTDFHLDRFKTQEDFDHNRIAASGFLIRVSVDLGNPLIPSILRDLEPSEIMSMINRVGFTIRNANSEDVGILESHFSKMLVQTCIVNDIKGASELLNSILSNAKVEAVTSFRDSQIEHWTGTFESFRPLHWATLFGNTEIVRLLLEHKAIVTSTTASGLTSVDIAAILGHVKILGMLVEENREEIDFLPPKPPLFERPCHLAAAHARVDDVEAIMRLLRPPPDSKSARREMTSASFNGMLTNVGETPMHRAAAMGNIHAARALVALDKGADINKQDNFGRAAVWHASIAGATDVVSFLLENGADITVPDRYGLTALHAACREGHSAIVDLLLRHDITAYYVHPETTNFTPAHFATLSGDIQTLEVLQKNGLNLDEFVERGRGRGISPVHIAMVNFNSECFEYLRSAGCNVTRDGWYHVLLDPTELSGIRVTPKKVRLRKETEGKSVRSHSDRDVLEVQYGYGELSIAY